MSPIKGNNHDLREWLEKSGVKAVKKVKIYSEADELGLSAGKIGEIRECIDAVLEG